MSPEDRIAKANSAEYLLGQAREYLNGLRLALTKRVMEEKDELIRAEYWRQHHGLALLESRIQHDVDDGKIAKRELEDKQKQK